MRIRQYLAKHQMNIADFCKMCNISIATLYRIFEGKEPSLTTAIKIEKATEGYVTLAHILSYMKDEK